MAITTYTTADEVRDALGVSAEEIEDSSIDTSINDFILRAELKILGADILTDFNVVKAIASRTTSQSDFYEMVKIYSTYIVANHLLGSLPLFSPKTIIEDKSNVTRYSDSPYKAVSISVRSSYIRFRKMLVDAYATYSSVSVTATPTQSLMSVASPTYDPVTGS